MLENEKLAVPDLDAEEVRVREAARERARAIVAMNTGAATAGGGGSYEGACFNQDDVVTKAQLNSEVVVPALEIVDEDAPTEINIDDAFKVRTLLTHS